MPQTFSRATNRQGVKRAVPEEIGPAGGLEVSFNFWAIGALSSLRA